MKGDHEFPIFTGVPVIKTEEAPLVDEHGGSVDYSIRTDARGFEEILVHPTKWDQFCEAMKEIEEHSKGRSN